MLLLGIINHLGNGVEELHRHLKYDQRKGGYEENREGMAKDLQEGKKKSCAQPKGQGSQELQGGRRYQDCQLQKYQIISVATTILFNY